MEEIKVAVIGGGAAGFFCALNAGVLHSNLSITLYEQGNKLLSKVKISGGGRCNVTHNCFDNIELSKNYPRGERELRSAFSRFNVADTMEWFEIRGVKLKTEEDGRIFPITDNSETIIECLLKEAERRSVKIKTNSKIIAIQKGSKDFTLVFQTGETTSCDKLVIATGGNPKDSSYDWLKNLGHTIIPPVPSLFTFNIPHSTITELPGISVQAATVKILGTNLKNSGPLLITHWGLSGPAILKLSALGARKLNELNYSFNISVNWLNDLNEEAVKGILIKLKASEGNKFIVNDRSFNLPKRLWEHLINNAGIGNELRWSDVSIKKLNLLVNCLINDDYKIEGKTTFKEEFVTCGGVSLKEVDLKSMESRKCEGLFFAGEVLDIDGITGGFNFQNAWTTGWIAANGLGASS